MKTIIVIILTIFLYPTLTTQAGTNPVNCYIAGSYWGSAYVFDIKTLPERCEIITVGQYGFDLDDGTNTGMTETDKGVVKTLIEAKKTVYTRIGFVIEDDWRTIFDPADPSKFQTEIFDPLINFLNTVKVHGILINTKYSLYKGKIENLAKKVSDFVSAIKKKLDKLIIGLMIIGSDYDKFSQNNLFDFTITNGVLDLYVIDWGILNDCLKDMSKIEMTPITSTNPNITSIEQVTTGVTKSSMDKLKIHAMIQMIPVIPEILVAKGDNRIEPYSNFCAYQGPNSQWCTSPPRLSYDQGAYAKKYYVGLILEQLDTDDFNGKCDCSLFPVTNSIIDGWSACDFKDCPKLDREEKH